MKLWHFAVLIGILLGLAGLWILFYLGENIDNGQTTVWHLPGEIIGLTGLVMALFGLALGTYKQLKE